MRSFDELVAEAVEAPFSGWDFSWLRARSTPGTLPWSYPAEVAARSGTAASMLDMGTGGGEVLARIRPRPARTVATEAWLQNVGVAAGRLAPLGIPVVHCDGAPENAGDAGGAAATDRRGLLPFGDAVFDLVINRHEAFRADEVYRVLAPGGIFVTQQVDSHNFDDVLRLLGLEPPDLPPSWLPSATSQLTSAGLVVTTARAGALTTLYHDIGAVVYYLKVVGYAFPEYRLQDMLPRLRDAFETASLWPYPVRETRFLAVAEKPAP